MFFDLLARLVARESHPLSRIIGNRPVHEKFVFMARPTPTAPWELVLSDSAELVVETVVPKGHTCEVGCLLGHYRVTPRGAQWEVQVLPGMFGWLGKTCPHGSHTPQLPPVNDPLGEHLASATDEAALEEAYRALLASKVLMINMNANTGPNPSIQFVMVPVGGQTCVPMFTSAAWLPAEPGLRVSTHEFTFLLGVMNPPRAPVVINPFTKFQHVISVEKLAALSAGRAEQAPPLR